MEIEAQVKQGVYRKDVADQLGIHPRTVSRALQRGGPPKRQRAKRSSKVDSYKPLIDELLRQGVWNCAVLFQELKSRGYTGGRSILRSYVQPRRVLRQGKQTVRFETAPGKQLQSDWGEIRTMVAGEHRKVYFSVNTLGYSRRFFFWCTDRQDAEHTYESLVLSFEHFGGTAAEVLVDNQKPCVLGRQGGQVRFHPRFLDLASHYGFRARACRPYRARTKGKDERMVGYIKGNFFQRYRNFESLAHMNALALKWLQEEADRRYHGTVKEVVSKRFEREQPHLQPLPQARYDTSYREQRFVSWDGYIDVRGNRYSVPAHLCGKPVTIRITLDHQLKVFDDITLVVNHGLREQQRGWVTLPAHHAPLWCQALQVQRRDLTIYEEAACN